MIYGYSLSEPERSKPLQKVLQKGTHLLWEVIPEPQAIVVKAWLLSADVLTSKRKSSCSKGLTHQGQLLWRLIQGEAVSSKPQTMLKGFKGMHQNL